MVGLLESLLIGIGIGSICGGCIGICLSIIKYYNDSNIHKMDVENITKNISYNVFVTIIATNSSAAVSSSNTFFFINIPNNIKPNIIIIIISKRNLYIELASLPKTVK